MSWRIVQDEDCSWIWDGDHGRNTDVPDEVRVVKPYRLADETQCWSMNDDLHCTRAEGHGGIHVATQGLMESATYLRAWIEEPSSPTIIPKFASVAEAEAWLDTHGGTP